MPFNGCFCLHDCLCESVLMNTGVLRLIIILENINLSVGQKAGQGITAYACIHTCNSIAMFNFEILY